MTLISIIIRARNEASNLAELLPVLAAQHWQDREILLIDNGSTDGSQEIARTYCAKIIEFGDHPFSYGKASNLGAQHAQGDILVYLSADCTPISADWLGLLVDPLWQRPNIVASFGGQVPRPGSSLVWAANLVWAQDQGTQLVRVEQIGRFSASNCALLRSVWESQSFDEAATYGEDLLWARQAAEPGTLIAYVGAARVFHSHRADWNFIMSSELPRQFARRQRYLSHKAALMTLRSELQLRHKLRAFGAALRLLLTMHRQLRAWRRMGLQGWADVEPRLRDDLGACYAMTLIGRYFDTQDRAIAGACNA